MRCARGQVRDAPSRSGDATLHPAAHAPPRRSDGHQNGPARTGTGHSRHLQMHSQIVPLRSGARSSSFTSGVDVRKMRTMYWPLAARARRSCRLPLRLRAANIGRWQAAPACWQHANAQRLCRTPNGRELCFRCSQRRRDERGRSWQKIYHWFNDPGGGLAPAPIPTPIHAPSA